MGVSFRCPLTLVRKYFLPGAAVYAELPSRTFCSDGSILFLLSSVWQPPCWTDEGAHPWI